ncbi:hypothetical protein DFJ73DRAFT_822876 [Zopfochytrium polystomum]|nr:hypothetical protein DFJ73DRAFT_822876 [Zopfochytrium polystomum]
MSHNVSLRLTEKSRSVQLEIPGFSTLSRSESVSYGASPFLVGGRKWGLNVYPHGLRQASPTFGQLADIYVHIWARDKAETEEEFLRFVRSHGIHFVVTLTEPEPAAMSMSFSSTEIWSDMEDAAGWYHITLDAPPPLLELTNDTLIIIIDFQPSPAVINSSPSTPTAASFNGAAMHSSLAQTPISNSFKPSPTKPFDRFKLFPAAHWDPAMKGLFNNSKVSDFEVIADGQPIYVQRCFLEAKVGSEIWQQALDGSAQWTTPPAPPPNPRLRDAKHGSQPNSLMVNDVPFEIVRSVLLFIYTGEFELEQTPTNLGYVHVLCERFGLNDLRRFAAREIYRHIKEADAIDLLQSFGGKSSRLQEIIVFFIVHNFALLRENGSLKQLISAAGKDNGDSARRLLALLRRIDVASDNSKRPSALDSVPSSSITPTPKLDWRRSMAFRSLLSNPLVADVHFVVEGRTIYAQKSVLSALSDYFLAMFTRSWSENTVSNGPSIVEITDFPYSTFYNMLLFLYINEIDPPGSMHETGLLYVVADKYDIQDLVRHSESLLVRQMTPNNITEFLFDFAYQYETLKKLSFSYFVREFNQIRQTPDFARVISRAHEYSDFSGLISEFLEEVAIKGFVKAEACDLENGVTPSAVSPDLTEITDHGDDSHDVNDTLFMETALDRTLSNASLSIMTSPPLTDRMLTKSHDVCEHDLVAKPTNSLTKVRSPSRSNGSSEPLFLSADRQTLTTPSEGEEVWDDPLDGTEDIVGGMVI